MKRRLFSTSVALAALTLAALPALAHSERPPAPADRIGALMQVSVVDRASGRELPIYNHRGEYWVAGTPGARYAIRVRNAAGERVMAVMSVDGVNVVTGETAGYGQTGYVFGAGDMSDIAGWRKSDAQIAAFEFTSLGDSYASRTGRPDNVGVIGVALFRERVQAPPPSPPVSRNESFGSAEPERRARAPSAAQESKAQADAATGEAVAQARPAPSLGTGHGRRETSVVGHTSFERAQAAPNELIRIRYASRENLVAAGVIPVPPVRWPRPATPSPFPESSVGYVPDPPTRY